MSDERRIRVGVLMGGASAEREISLASGKMIAEHLPRDRYDVVMLDTLALMAHHPGLTPALRERAQALIGHHSDARGELAAHGHELPEAFQDQIREAAEAVVPATEALAAAGGQARIDVAFIALHGRYGEDGTIQGMLDLFGIPYVGSGTLASALAMDKAMAKRIFGVCGIPTPSGLTFDRADFDADPDACCAHAAAFVPAVVKPAREGSSIGMSLVDDAAAMPAALRAAFARDARVLVEERVGGTELTVGVIGNRELLALPVVEIVPKRAFFDYKAKYDPALSDEICPARVCDDVAREAQELARRAHRALDCRGLSRTDMILSERGLVVLELNTLPGMTVNSLLPKAARAAGIPFGELLHRLIQLALED
jgi:D-alanine-D-alanine ligase